eukprot:SAG25_NODE_4090_length_892_cov_1.348045_3_plen_60_part_01
MTLTLHFDLLWQLCPTDSSLQALLTSTQVIIDDASSTTATELPDGATEHTTRAGQATQAL